MDQRPATISIIVAALVTLAAVALAARIWGDPRAPVVIALGAVAAGVQLGRVLAREMARRLTAPLDEPEDDHGVSSDQASTSGATSL